MSLLTATATPIAGLMRLERTPRVDNRGFFSRLFCDETLAPFGWSGPIRQINHTMTRLPGTVRGLHFQKPPHAEAKIVQCLAGEIFDVAVDIRAGSPTFLHWHAERLSSANMQSLLIPAGFAHGFQALTPDCVLVYLHSEQYSSTSEDALNVRDPRLAIDWPRPIGELSERDANHPMLSSDFSGIKL